jgi:hypothetical protein
MPNTEPNSNKHKQEKGRRSQFTSSEPVFVQSTKTIEDKSQPQPQTSSSKKRTDKQSPSHTKIHTAKNVSTEKKQNTSRTSSIVQSQENRDVYSTALDDATLKNLTDKAAEILGIKISTLTLKEPSKLSPSLTRKSFFQEKGNNNSRIVYPQFTSLFD